MQILWNLAALFPHVLLDCFGRAFADFRPVRQIHAAHTGLRREFEKDGTGALPAVAAQTVGQLQRGFAFRCIIPQAGEGRAADQLAARGAAHRDEIRRQAVPIGNGAGFIQDHGVDVPAGFHRFARHGDDIKAGHAVHARDPNGGQQPADGGRDEADGQRDQRGNLQLDAGIQANGIQGDDDNQKDDGQRYQQRVQRNFIRCLFPGSAFDQRDHPI